MSSKTAKIKASSIQIGWIAEELGDIFAEEYKSMIDNPPMDLYIITTARKRDTHEWDQELLSFLLSAAGS